MAWGVSIMDLGDYQAVTDIPEDFKPAALGTEDEVRQKLKAFLPNLGDGDTFETDEIYFQFSLHGTDDDQPDQITSIGCRIAGSDGGGSCALAVAKHFGVRAVCHSSGEFLDEDDPDSGLREWKAFRDRNINQ